MACTYFNIDSLPISFPQCLVFQGYSETEEPSTKWPNSQKGSGIVIFLERRKSEDRSSFDEIEGRAGH